MASTVSLCLLVCLVCIAVTIANEREHDSDVAMSKRSIGDRLHRRRQRQQARNAVSTIEGEDSIDPSGTRGARRRQWRRRQGRRDGARQGEGRRNGGRHGQRHSERRPNRLQRVRERIAARIAAGEVILSEMTPRARRFITFLSNAVTTFTTRLHRQLDDMDHMVYSPYGIYKALSMSYMGASGLTAFQMKRVLGLQGLGRQCHRAHKKMDLLLSSARNVIINTPSTVILKEGVDLMTAFSQRLNLLYMTNITRLNMLNVEGPEASVNDWISSQTDNRIATILSSGYITEEPDLILVNGVYFKSQWKTAFPIEHTSDKMFKRTPTEEVPVQMMQVDSQFRLGLIPGQSGRVLEMPFRDDRFSMVIYLPNEPTGLNTIEDGLTDEIISINLETVIPTRVQVELPKFTMQSAWCLKNHLQGMGLTKPFDEGTAEFGLATNSTNLYINDVVHKTVVEIDEEGVTTADIGSDETAETFHCHHPFLFVIRHNSSKMPMIVGKFSGES